MSSSGQDDSKTNFGTSSFAHACWHTLGELIVELEAIMKVQSLESGEIRTATWPILWAMIDHCKTFSLVSSAGHFRANFVLARVIFEHALNITFILAEGEQAASRAVAHLRQKRYRDFKREINIAEETWSVFWMGADEFLVDDVLKEALDTFTTKGGRESRSWLSINIDKVLEVLIKTYGNKARLAMVFGRYYVYRHSSEVIHGTLFGAMFPFGLTEANAERNEQYVARSITSNDTMLILMVGAQIELVIHGMSLHYENDAMKEINERVSGRVMKLIKQGISAPTEE